MAEREFVLPDLGEGLEEATVDAWLVAEGDRVELNQPIAEIQTAKAAVEVPSPYAGRIARLHVEAGATVAVGAPLVTFEVEGAQGAPREEGARATPAVRKLAKELGVALSSVTGTGPDGRITRADVEEAFNRGIRGAVHEIPLGPEPDHAWTVTMTPDAEEVPVSVVRRAIADRLTEAAAIPQVTTFRTVDCTELETVRRELGVSPLPVFVRALAEICTSHPMLNSTWADDRILVHRRVHVGVAVDTGAGLVVPVVHDATEMGIGAISTEIDRLARAARERTLDRDTTTGATIAVTNTGSYGSEWGTPLLNPGHAVTIALGVIEPRALVVDDRVEARPACTLSLTFDHRVVDGATVGRALGALVELLQSRERLDALPR